MEYPKIITAHYAIDGCGFRDVQQEAADRALHATFIHEITSRTIVGSFKKILGPKILVKNIVTVHTPDELVQNIHPDQKNLLIVGAGHWNSSSGDPEYTNSRLIKSVESQVHGIILLSDYPGDLSPNMIGTTNANIAAMQAIKMLAGFYKK